MDKMFEVDTSSLVNVASGIDSTASSLSNLESRLRKAEVNKVLAGKSYRSVLSSVVKVSQTYSKRASSIRSLAAVTRTVAKAYTDAENTVIQNGHTMLGKSTKSQASHIGQKSTGVSDSSVSSTKKSTKSRAASSEIASTNSIISDRNSRLIEWAKKLLGFIKVVDEDTDKATNAGYYAGLVDYLASFVNCFDPAERKGKGYQDLVSFTGHSVSFLQSVFESYEEKAAAGELGLISSIAGLAATGVGWAEGNYESRLDFIVDWGDNAVNIGESIYDLRTVNQETADRIGLLKGDTLLKNRSAKALKALALLNWPKNVVMGLIKGGWGITKASAKSFDKYVMSDRDMSIDDFSRMGVEISVSGLLGILDGVSAGWVSESTTGLTYENSSNWLFNKAEEMVNSRTRRSSAW